MDETVRTAPKPRVIAISGSVGSGKSTVAAQLSDLLGDAPVLSFDHYGEYIEWPQDMERWMQEGFDPSAIRVPRLKDDLLALRNGGRITYPADDRIMGPGKYIILEEPSGRERDEISALVDLVVYIDLPQDICVMRMIQRVLDWDIWVSQATFESQLPEDLVRQLDGVALWLAQYNQARSMYIAVSEMVRRNADLLVEGIKPVDQISKEIWRFLNEKYSGE